MKDEMNEQIESIKQSKKKLTDERTSEEKFCGD